MSDYTTQRCPGSDRISVRCANGQQGYVVKTHRRAECRKVTGWAVFTQTGSVFVGPWDAAVAMIRSGKHRVAKPDDDFADVFADGEGQAESSHLGTRLGRALAGTWGERERSWNSR